MKTQDTINFGDVKKIRMIDCHQERAEFLVNEALVIGWQMLTMRLTEQNIIFVMGWSGEGEPPQSPSF